MMPSYNRIAASFHQSYKVLSRERSLYKYSAQNSKNWFSTSSPLSSSQKETLTTPGTPRPFTILGLQQIAIGCREDDRPTMNHLWQTIFGLPKIGSHVSEKENVVEDILLLGVGFKGTAGARVEVDLMSPFDENKSPKVHVPPLNHIGLWVDDLESAVGWMKQNGVRFTPGGIRKGAAGHDVTFIHPKGNDESPNGGNGVLIELVQAPAEIIDSYDFGRSEKV